MMSDIVMMNVFSVLKSRTRTAGLCGVPASLFNSRPKAFGHVPNGHHELPRELKLVAASGASDEVLLEFGRFCLG